MLQDNTVLKTMRYYPGFDIKLPPPLIPEAFFCFNIHAVPWPSFQGTTMSNHQLTGPGNILPLARVQNTIYWPVAILHALVAMHLLVLQQCKYSYQLTFSNTLPIVRSLPKPNARTTKKAKSSIYLSPLDIGNRGRWPEGQVQVMLSSNYWSNSLSYQWRKYVACWMQCCIRSVALIFVAAPLITVANMELSHNGFFDVAMP